MSLTYARVWMLSLCFVVVLLDGLDTSAVALVAPVLARQWGIAPAALTPAFVATSVGAVVGYVACGPLAQRVGLRVVGVASVVLFGVGTLLTALAGDVAVLAIMRLVSAVGLGGALPVAVTVATTQASEKTRTTVAMLVATGLSAGGVVGGLISGPLMVRFGWASVFVVGGVLPLLLLPALWRMLGSADAAHGAMTRAGGHGTLGALFADGLAAATALLWAFAFLIFLVSYALLFWIPTLLVAFGFAPTDAPLAAAAFGAGGLVGNAIVMLLVGRAGITPALAAAALCALACIVAIGCGLVPPALLLLAIGAVGAGLITGCVGQSALAVSFYPPALRTTGVGWSAASGRIGSIVGPAVGGALLSIGWPARDIVLTAAPAVIAAIFALAALSLAGRRVAPAGIAQR
ncbi:MFS transporter [Bradyrhizobium sp. U87765 SZCCT0131]|uniref:MFS transporter n=1 Tax=unclassified Bradyrhizobium TaxID=2631580 RepID=UPI001BA80F06|nr:MULTISPECIES: MFS transporter [unclassified Bradyrhizobium]MBR1219840.1 MFS transporter [Bradyrhizobium sp. U87765 SZCCT0131]MBR1262491.1 MFS transporter [Bradyrhizobium sp. U87765 SZCCT0134]MBR1308326.1 MFS transporter [Bradyrhizobium sp. U87765 SZCCT0110]MBR1318273.1 MFS transporter [Bradyrhizobium sp. U87765 SZCCT0109]MBR1351976.1 MFS transporter [Bradyrhizobium sp. U87765 SZCCT0048]